MKLEDALKQNPYDKTRGSKGAYIRYLRYTVDGWYSKKSEEIRKQKACVSYLFTAGGAAVIRGGMDVQPFAAVIPRLYEMPEK